jgi:O-antigen/teichoic acid export membrane protein
MATLSGNLAKVRLREKDRAGTAKAGDEGGLANDSTGFGIMRVQASISLVRRRLGKLPPASAYVFAVAADKGFSLLTIPLMANRLSPASLGEFDVAVSVIEFIGLLATLGIAETCIRFSRSDVPGKPEATAGIFGAALLLAAGFCGIVQLCLVPAARAIGIAADTSALRIAAAGVCATGLIELPLVWLRLNGHRWRYLGFIGARAAIQAVATVAVLLAGFGAKGLLISNGVLLLAFAGALSTAQFLQTGIRFETAPFPLIARYGLPLTGGLLAMFALGNCDRWFLSGRVPPQDIAFYGLAAKLALVTAVAYQPFLLWWSARRLAILREEGLDKLAEAWGQGISLLMLSALFVALAMPVFIDAFFPASYGAAAFYLPLLVLISVLNELCSLCNTGAYAMSHGFRVLAVNAAGAAVAISAYAALIPAQGVMGAIEATMLAQLVRLGLFLVTGRKAAPVPYPWDLAAIAACLVAASISFAPPASDYLSRGLWLLGSEAVLGAALIAIRLLTVPPSFSNFCARLQLRLLPR